MNTIKSSQRLAESPWGVYVPAGVLISDIIGIDDKEYDSYLSENRLAIKADSFAKELHSKEIRLSARPYITHLRNSAKIALKLNFTDEYLISTVLLHDSIENSDITPNNLRKEFGKHITLFVGEVTRWNKLGDSCLHQYEILPKEWIETAHSHGEVAREKYRNQIWNASYFGKITKVADAADNSLDLTRPYIDKNHLSRFVNDAMHCYLPLSAIYSPEFHIIIYNSIRNLEKYKNAIKNLQGASAYKHSHFFFI